MHAVSSPKNTAEMLANMYAIAEKAKAEGLFKHYENDLHLHDRDTLENDAQASDQYLWIIKTCGTWLCLIDGSGGTDALLSVCESNERYFVLGIPCPGHLGSIKEYPRSEIRRAIDNVKPVTNRVPRREYFSSLLPRIHPHLANTVIPSDIGWDDRKAGKQILFQVEGTALTALYPTGKSRSLACSRVAPVAQHWRVRFTSDFGHAELEAITPRLFLNAIKRAASASDHPI